MSGPAGSHAAAAQRPLSVVIVGGGLAGLSAAVVLGERGVRVTLLEARRRLGGRAGSFCDPDTGQWIDHCQHVGMGCCTALADLFHRTGLAPLMRREKVLHFFSPEGQRYDLRAAAGLPAPLHLLPGLMRLGYLSLADRLHIARCLLRLARSPAEESSDSPTIGQWLDAQKTSPAARDRFWSVVLVSALGETLEHASLSAARKVFVDGFMSAREAYCVDVPQVPLDELYDAHLSRWLGERGVEIKLGTPVQHIAWDGRQVTGVELSGGESIGAEAVMLAVPWNRVGDLLPPDLVQAAGVDLAALSQIESSPITGVHLWYDRPITRLTHAVLVDRLAQWVFRREGEGWEGEAPADPTDLRRDREHGSAGASPSRRDVPSHYYQVVISASRSLAGRDRQQVIEEVAGDLAAVFPDAAAARLLRWRMVTQQQAVFSARPGLDRIRPDQRTGVPNLMLAGDWTRTGWPSTMEGAVRSGHTAATAILQQAGLSPPPAISDLPRQWPARWLLSRRS